MYQFSFFFHIFRMENGIKMIFVSKWFLIPVEYIDSKITIWPPDDISFIYLCWVTNIFRMLVYLFVGLTRVNTCLRSILRVCAARCMKASFISFYSVVLHIKIM